jgi:hypothetical protein
MKDYGLGPRPPKLIDGLDGITALTIAMLIIDGLVIGLDQINCHFHWF